MQTTRVGRAQLEVSRIGLGCVTFGREIDENTSFRVMDFAFEKGINLFDTAESYGGAEAQNYRRNVLGVEDVREMSGESHSSEKIIGRWLKARGVRKEIVLQTKITTNFKTAHVAQAVDDSLDRLQTDMIDIYLFHTFDTQTPLVESLEAMAQCIRRGKIRSMGCSNFTANQLMSALDVSQQSSLLRLEVIQPVYNLAARDIENDLLRLCRKEQVAVITYSPLGAGFLSGKYTRDRSSFPKRSRFDVIPSHADDYFSERSFRIVEQLRKKSSTTGIPMVRLAMAWVLRNPDLTSVLVGAREASHLENALLAMDMEFPDSWMTEMNSWR